MDDDETPRLAIRQDFLQRLKHLAVKTVGILRTLVIEVDLLIHLFGKIGQHRIALGQRLLIGDPVGTITGLLHDVHDRRLRQIQIRMLLVGESQHLLQGFDGIGTRSVDLIEQGQLITLRAQLRIGGPPVTIQAHVQTAGRFAQQEHQRPRFIGAGIHQFGNRRNALGLLTQGLHARQLLLVAAIADQKLPGHGRLHAVEH